MTGRMGENINCMKSKYKLEKNEKDYIWTGY
jgi:hypothetical protein